MPTRLHAAFAGLSLALAPCALAHDAPPEPDAGALADLDLEQLLALEVGTVRSASKHEQSILDAPASVSIVTADEIRAMGHRTLGEILQGVRGLFTTSDRNYTYLGIRGFARPGDYNTRILLLVDGHALNENVYDSAMVGDETPLDVELIDRVEIVRGPSSSLHGGNAFFGVVNVITRAPAERAEAVASVAGGSDAQRGARLEWSGPLSDARVRLSVSGSEADGPDIRYPELAAPGGGLIRGLDWGRYGRAFGRIDWRGLTLQGGWGARDKGVPTAAFTTAPGDRRFETRDVRAWLEAAWEGRAQEHLDLAARAYLDHFRFTGSYPTPDADRVIMGEDLATGRWAGVEARALYHPSERLSLTIGTEARRNLRQDQVYLWDGEATLDVPQRSTVIAGYAQVEAAPVSALRLVAGLRHDRFDALTAWSPRFAAILSPAARTRLKLLTGRAFRPPNVYERFYWEGTPPLDSETVWTHEAVLEQLLWRGARLTGSLYTYRARGVIEGIQEGELTPFRNLLEVSGRGAEAELEQRLAGVTARLSWATQRTEDLATSRSFSNSPLHLGKLHLFGPLRGPFEGGLELLHVSARGTLDGAEVGASTAVNANLRARGLWRGRLDAWVGVRNLFDAAMADPGSVEHVQDVLPGDGRSFRVGMEGRF